MKKNAAADSDQGYMVTAWGWAGDIDATKGLGVRVVLTPTARIGVWRVRTQAVSTVDGKAHGVVCQTTAEFPNGRASTLTALVFALLVELEAELGKDELQAP